MKQTLFSLLFCLLLFPALAMAHKIHVFAWVSENRVTVESAFSGNRPLVHGMVTVTNAKSQDTIVQGKGDAKGLFVFDIPATVREQQADMLITVSGGEGHQSQWVVPAAEYLSEQLPETKPVVASTTTDALEQRLQTMIREELAPIKRSLAKAEKQDPRLRDILGGIGYLLGLAGLISWMRYRK